MNLNGKKARFGHLLFPITKESIACAIKLPREGDRWHKRWFVLQASHNIFLKPEFQYMTGKKDFHHNWIKPKFLNPLKIIIHLITSKGNFSIFKSYHLRLLAHFVEQKYLNFPYYFLRRLEKMSNQVRKNTVNPKGILYHHSLINLLILDQLKERSQP